MEQHNLRNRKMNMTLEQKPSLGVGPARPSPGRGDTSLACPNICLYDVFLCVKFH